MQVFAEGYNREQDIVAVDEEYLPVIILDVGVAALHDENIKTVPSVSFRQKKKTAPSSHNNYPMGQDHAETYGQYSHTQKTPTPITTVRNPKNQLTSLIKNARENQESLQQRNQRRSQHQKQSKRQYGW